MHRKQAEGWSATILFLIAITILIISGNWAAGFSVHYQPRHFAGMVFHYDYLFNYFLPRLAVPVLYYAGFLCINFYLYPRFFVTRRINLFIGSLLLLTGIIWLLFCLLYYWKEVYQLPDPQEGKYFFHFMQAAFPPVLIFTILMTLYFGCRDYLTPRFLRAKEKSRLFRKLSRHTTVFLLIWAVLIIFLLLTNHGEHPIALTLSVYAAPFIFIYYALNNFWLISLFEGEKRWLIKYAAVVISVSFLIAFIASFAFFITRSAGNVQIMPVFLLYWIILLAGTPLIWLLYRQTNEQAKQLIKLRSALTATTANIDLLKSQINPHFLFNALNTLYGTAIQENSERTAQGIQKLGDMMRFMLRENMMHQIPLQREVQYLKDYIDLQMLRTQTSDNIRITTNLNDRFYQHDIAPMLLIPFVENAFKHGISLRNPSWINITLSCTPDQLYLDVHNSLQPKNENDPERHQAGIGLENTRKRLSLLYPGQHELTIHQSATEFFIHLTISFKKDESFAESLP